MEDLVGESSKDAKRLLASGSRFTEGWINLWILGIFNY